jgi:16S rRNA (cytosine967-C5)-methyltransferase
MTYGEPWSLTLEQLSVWKPAVLMAERLHKTLVTGGPKASPIAEDYPTRMLKEWEEDWGIETRDRLVQALAQEAPLTLRVRKRIAAKTVLGQLREDGILPVKAETSQILAHAIRISGYASVLNSKSFERAEFEIQDEGSQLMSLFALFPERVAGILSHSPGASSVPAEPICYPETTPPWTVVDACAGAGGKTLALADVMGGSGRIFSYDTSVKKLQALKRRASHAGFTNIQTAAVTEGSESLLVGKFRRRADVVLVDAPCSGWGVLRRNPDTKWRQQPDVLDRMPVLQLRLLSEYSELVAPGGRLVFGVCTFRRSETRGVVQEFLKGHPDFTEAQGGYLGPSPMDGFFMQAFNRRAKD